MPKKREGEMKMILAVLIVKATISMCERNDKVRVYKNENGNRQEQPAEVNTR